MPLARNILKQLAKSVLIPLGLTAVASATDAAIHSKMFGSGCPSDLASRVTILISSNDEIKTKTQTQIKTQLEQVKTLLDQVRIFNAASSFNKF